VIATGLGAPRRRAYAAVGAGGEELAPPGFLND
jgi:hypothetical protein